jgi:cytosine/adenosine deaminase-related metal-dependent hydrolase
MQTARYAARWILPVASEPVSDGAVLVVAGRIAAVGPRTTVPLPDDAIDVDLGDAILLPGMINVHAHPELSVLRNALEDLPFHEWIPRLRRMKLAVGFDAEDWRDAAMWTCAEAAAAGITSLGATEDSDGALHALRAAGMRGVTWREVFSPSPSDATSALLRLIDIVAEMRDLETDLVRVGVSPHAPYSVADELFSAVAHFARDENLAVAVHAAESETEQLLVTLGTGFFAESLQGRGIATPVRGASTVDMLRRTGILDLAPLLIHCVRVNATDIAHMAASGARIAHCPVANARLGHGVAPLMEMLDAGITAGLGTDSVASNNRIDLLEEARIAQLMQRARLASSSVLPATELLRLVTIDGARALGIDDRVGTLEIGKDADLCAVRLTGIHVRPVIDPVAALFMAARGTDVMLTMVRGRVIYRDGAHLTIDMGALGARFDALGERVRSARDGISRDSSTRDSGARDGGGSVAAGILPDRA